MADAEVKIQVSKDIIDAHVRSAVMQVLAKDQEALIKAVVDAAMNQKRDHYSASKTIWEEKLNEMIRDVANKYLAEWIEQQRPAIHKALATKLTAKGTAGAIADGIVSAMSQVHVSLNLTDRRDR